jgi:hypothetical protein
MATVFTILVLSLLYFGVRELLQKIGEWTADKD